MPLGNGQLKQKQATDYYEKVCVDERLAGFVLLKLGVIMNEILANARLQSIIDFLK